MKIKSLPLQTLCIALLLVILAGCRDGLLEEIINRKGLVEKIQLQEMIHNGRHYEFIYDRKGRIDYIDVSESDELMYTYDVTYKQDQLYSAALVEGGEIVSENHNFEFDADGNVTGFTYTGYYVEEEPEGIHFPYDLAYDDENRLVSLASAGEAPGTFYAYDNRDNLIKETTPNTETRYTHDNKFNPLQRIPDLMFLLVEETGFWEFILSEHNSLTRSHTQFNGEVVNTTYANEYDKFFRLVSKTGGGDEFVFLYD